MLSPAPARSVIKPQPRATAVIDWRELAACKGWAEKYGSDPWFPDRPSAPSAYETAEKICESCPVVQQCLEFALGGDNGRGQPRWGMYAGMTPEERASMARRRKRQEQKERREA